MLCLPCAISPRPRSSVRKENQTKDIRKDYSVSSRMKHAQTKPIDYYSPLSFPHPSPAPSQLRLIVALRPFQPLFSYIRMGAFCWFFKKQYIQPLKRRSLPVHEHETINVPGRLDTLLTGPSRIQEGRYKSRKGWP